jgi:hypothetical protein
LIDNPFSECEDKQAISSQLSAISKRNFLMAADSPIVERFLLKEAGQT